MTDKELIKELVETAKEALRWYDAGKPTSKGFIMAITSKEHFEKLRQVLKKAGA